MVAGVRLLWFMAGGFLPLLSPHAGVIQLPTPNDALLRSGGGEKFFVGTVGKSWTSGQYGCVRSEGGQWHEGIDIRCVERDRRGEPADAILATADGTVLYLNEKAGLSNYGIYVVIGHRIEGLQVFSLYAHLDEIRPDLKPQSRVRAGERIGTMGRTANTAQGISKERAHLHFELAVFLNENFSEWYRKTFPGQRNDHGIWNGQNLVGFDPVAVFTAQRRLGDAFSLLEHLRSRRELFRVQVRRAEFSWIKRYQPLARTNPAPAAEDVAGYEIAFDAFGLPFEFVPLSAAEFTSKQTIRLLSVNSAEHADHPCRALVRRRSGEWQLTATGTRLVELLTY
jgi:murein DD-endopeptidase MepM/ murein hydrolase activator NlpD